MIRQPGPQSHLLPLVPSLQRLVHTSPDASVEATVTPSSPCAGAQAGGTLSSGIRCTARQQPLGRNCSSCSQPHGARAAPAWPLGRPHGARHCSVCWAIFRDVISFQDLWQEVRGWYFGKFGHGGRSPVTFLSLGSCLREHDSSAALPAVKRPGASPGPRTSSRLHSWCQVGAQSAVGEEQLMSMTTDIQHPMLVLIRIVISQQD
jgi:hypothetical protein